VPGHEQRCSLHSDVDVVGESPKELNRETMPWFELPSRRRAGFRLLKRRTSAGVGGDARVRSGCGTKQQR
jgi:hypothetical protein